MSEPSKRKRTIKRVVWITVSSVFIFFYFNGLIRVGEWYRTNYPEKKKVQADLPLGNGWKFIAGDDRGYANAHFDDRNWKTVRPDSLGDTYKGGIAWFRLKFATDTFAKEHPVALRIMHSGASEVFLDGSLLASYGKVAGSKEGEVRFDPDNYFMSADLAAADSHVIAIRYSNHHFKNRPGQDNGIEPGFRFIMADRNELIRSFDKARFEQMITTSIGVFLFTLALVHLLLYLFYRKAKENLYYSIFAFCYSTIFIASCFAGISSSPEAGDLCSSIVLLFLNPILFLSLFLFIYHIFRMPLGFGGWLAIAVGVFGIGYTFFGWPGLAGYFISLVWYGVSCVITLMRGTGLAIKEKRPGARILGTGTTIFALLLFITISSMFFNGHLDISIGDENTFLVLAVILGLLSIPISMSVYLAYTSATTSNNLQMQLVEVERLSKDKQRILETQKEVLEQQVKERTVEIEEQKKVIEEKNKDITDSINYAKHIQEAILTSRETKYRLFNDAFVLFKPKDIVSGDFYWFAEQDGCRLIASCDCTGHGVPGALMSMIGNNILNQTVLERNITSPELVLEQLDKEVRRTLKQDEKSETKDGMDVALISFRSGNEMDYAGAQRPLWIIRNGVLEETKANKFSIGGGHSDQEKRFTKHSFNLDKGNCVYIFSDGFADQFNRDDKKLMTKRFKDILCSIQHLSMPEQEKYLDDFIENWKGNLEQTDDILVIGIRI